MSVSQETSAVSKKPTPELLAGIYVLVEGEEDVTSRPRCVPLPAEADAKPIVPTKEELAGHYLLVEGVEDLTEHPPETMRK